MANEPLAEFVLKLLISAITAIDLSHSKLTDMHFNAFIAQPVQANCLVEIAWLKLHDFTG